MRKKVAIVCLTGFIITCFLNIVPAANLETGYGNFHGNLMSSMVIMGKNQK